MRYFSIPTRFEINIISMRPETENESKFLLLLKSQSDDAKNANCQHATLVNFEISEMKGIKLTSLSSQALQRGKLKVITNQPYRRESTNILAGRAGRPSSTSSRFWGVDRPLPASPTRLFLLLTRGVEPVDPEGWGKKKRLLFVAWARTFTTNRQVRGEAAGVVFKVQNPNSQFFYCFLATKANARGRFGRTFLIRIRFFSS